MPPIKSATSAPLIPSDKTAIGTNFVRSFDADAPGIPRHHFRYDGALPQTDADRKRCVAALNQFLVQHPSVRLFPSPSGAARDVLLMRSFERGGVMYQLLASRHFVLSDVIDLSADVERAKQPQAPSSSTPALPEPQGRSQRVNFGSLPSKEAREQASIYQRARAFLDTRIAQFDRAGGSAEDRRCLIRWRESFDRAADELAAGKKPLRMDGIELGDTWRATNQMTGRDKAAKAMYEMACIVARLEGEQNPGFFAERVICPSSDGGILSTTAFALVPPWIGDSFLDRQFP